MRPHELPMSYSWTSQRKDTKNIPICVSKKQPLTKLQHLAVINYSINLFFLHHIPQNRLTQTNEPANFLLALEEAISPIKHEQNHKF